MYPTLARTKVTVGRAADGHKPSLTKSVVDFGLDAKNPNAARAVQHHVPCMASIILTGDGIQT